jgi:hypothetical protein
MLDDSPLQPLIPNALFEPGKTMASADAIKLMKQLNIHPFDLLTRFITGDWDRTDVTANNNNPWAIEKGYRISAFFYFGNENGLLINTNQERSETRIVLANVTASKYAYKKSLVEI